MRGYEFDARKDLSNRRKHGIDFDTAALIWEGYVFEAEDARFDYGEVRFIAWGAVGGEVFAVVYTWRGERRRLISARRAHSNEREIYRQALARAGASQD